MLKCEGKSKSYVKNQIKNKRRNKDLDDSVPTKTRKICKSIEMQIRKKYLPRVQLQKLKRRQI